MKNLLIFIAFALLISAAYSQGFDTVNVFQTRDTLVCGVDTLILDAGEGFESFIWNTGEDTRTIKVANTGTYDVTAVKTGGEMFQDTCYLTMARILQNPDTLCYKDELFLEVSESNLYYAWNTGNPEDTLYYLEVTMLRSETYEVEISNDMYGCYDSIRLDMYPKISLEFEQDIENKGCPGGDCKGQVTVKNVSGGTGQWSIDWDTPDVDPGDSMRAIGLCEGFVTVHIYDEAGCRFDTSYWVEVWDMPTVETTPDTITYLQDPRLTFWFENISEDTIQIVNYSWVLDNGTTSTEATPTFNFGYKGDGVHDDVLKFIYTTMNGCLDSNMIQVEVKIAELFVPNVFTPNGDGSNDTFIITVKDENEDPQKSYSVTGFKPINDYYVSNEIVIFNRWGKKVFEASNYDNDWDGEGLPEGTYFYVIKCQGELGEDIFNGAVTLLR